MAGTINSPTIVSPVKALGFYSFVVTIPDDDVYSFTPKGAVGHILLSTIGTAGHGLFWYRGSAQSKYAGSATTVGVSTACTGTTGVDGNLTLGAASNILYIENRTGAALEITVTLICANDSFE